MSKLWIKKRGQSGTVYLDAVTNESMPIGNLDDEPVGGFPFTARVEELKARFPGREYIIIEDTKQPPVSGVVISDARVLQAVPEAKREMGQQKLVRQPAVDALVPTGIMNVPDGRPQITSTNTVVGTSTPEIERAVCDKFRDNIKRWHYASGKEKKELGRDIEAIASFLIDMAPHLEVVLGRIKDEETLAKKRFTL
jgi:hypothetical protein